MKYIILSLLMMVVLATTAAAQDSKPEPLQFMQITTIESVVNGGLGRSKMITTLQTLKTYTDEGWKLVQVTPLSLSPGNSSSGIFMTRYLLSRPEPKK